MTTDDWDYERARALLRAQVAGAVSSTTTEPARPALHHRVATTAALAAVASAVVVGSWWVTTGGPVSTAVTAQAPAPSDATPIAPGAAPALVTVGGLQVVSVPAPGGGWVQVIVGPVGTTAVGTATPTSAPLSGNGSVAADPVVPAAVVAPESAMSAPVRADSGGGRVAVAPPPPPAPRTSAPAPSQTAPATVSAPTIDPPSPTPVDPFPGATSPSADPGTSATTDPGGNTGGSDSRATESGETGSSADS